MAETIDIRELNERIERQSAFITNLTTGMDQVIVGQKHLVESLLIGLLSDGHVLLEGVPGLAKTLAIKTLASLIDAKYSRIQFTPDLLPADVIGTMVYSQKDESFQVKKGPVFANFVLADEINRAPAKVQSALLEAMQERQVTIGSETFRLPEPFLVLATQNPIEQEGTYPLPEAQVDRFMLKVVIDYPKLEEEKLIIRQNISGDKVNVRPILKAEEVIEARKVVREIYRGHRFRHALSREVRSEGTEGHDRLRRFAPCVYQPRLGRKKLRLHQAPRLRHSRRRTCRGPRRAAPPHRADLRSRGRQPDFGRDCKQNT